MRRLRTERPPLSHEDARIIEFMADDASARVLASLPEDEQLAIRAHVVEDRDYADIAAAAVISVPAARMRVSRGLARLRATIRGPR